MALSVCRTKNSFVGLKCQTKYPKCWTQLHFVGLMTFSKENLLDLPEFLKNKNLVNEKSQSFAQIFEKYVL
jgi:hypothetical protein